MKFSTFLHDSLSTFSGLNALIALERTYFLLDRKLKKFTERERGRGGGESKWKVSPNSGLERWDKTETKVSKVRDQM